jgi:hypothetical protein
MPNQFYQDLVTQKSFDLLKKLRQQYKFILIGGWAVFLYTRALKSKDIDLIIDFEALSALKKKFELFKNDRLKKYEIKQEGLDVDLYVPYFSDLGLPTEEIAQRITSLESFKVPQLAVLLILKQVAWLNRRDSVKGEKDKIDIISLLLQEVNWSDYKKLLGQITVKENLPEKLKDLLKQTGQVPELGINNQQMAKLKRKILANFD